jgi:hypothetical protein
LLRPLNRIAGGIDCFRLLSEEGRGVTEARVIVNVDTDQVRVTTWTFEAAGVSTRLQPFAGF